jgi:HK97 family phage major capsid protein
MADERQLLKDELNTLTQTLRTEIDVKTKNFAPASEVKELTDKIIADQKEIISAIADLKKPEVKYVKGDIPKAVDPIYTKNFFNWMRGDNYERKALVSDATGQIMLPEELEATIREGLPQLNVIRNLSTVRTVGRQRVRARAFTNAPAVGWGKLELGAAVPNTTLVPSEAYVYPEDLNGLVQVGVDELADSDQNLAAYIANQFTISMANAEEAGYAIGAGHASQQPLGIMATTSGITRVANAAAAAVTFEDIKTLISNLPAQYRNGASFIMHTGTELMLQVLREFAYDATHFAGFMWQPSLIVGAPNTLCGYPVYNNDSFLQVAAGALTDVVAFGNFKYGYGVFDREGMSLKQLNELYITGGLVGFLATRRVTGYPIWPDAIRILREVA